jgi:hypothetical protein
MQNRLREEMFYVRCTGRDKSETDLPAPHVFSDIKVI